jgi:hypothetical protein
MNTDLDFATLAAEFAQKNAERFVTSAAAGIKDITNQVRARLRRTYKTYIERILERYGKGKSFFIRSESIPMYDFFVPLDLVNERRHLSRPTVRELGSLSPFSIITGSGGTGKSMMMRHMLVSCITAGLRTPIFLELRQLNQTEDTIREALLKVLQTFGLDVDDRFLEEALESGQLLLLLDGFDEVEQSLRKRIAAEIQDFERYPKTWLILSSRPDRALQGWEPFTEYHIAPLELETASNLIKKVPFDEGTKARFIRDMNEGLFEQHHSFLSNPLLLSIMLLTYGDVAYIPHKLSTFYSQAYEALFHRHDALKSGFQRDRKSSLDIQDFARAFSAFCLLSYDKRKFSFTSSEALQHISAARQMAMLSYDDDAFLTDAIQSTCLLIEEGLEITFAHRSFQEYFVARFIQNSPPEVKAKLVERFETNVNVDTVMALLWEIDPYIVERYYILPKLAQIRESVGPYAILGTPQLLKYLRYMYVDFTRDGGMLHSTLRHPDIHMAADFAYQRYRGDWANISDEEDAYIDAELASAFKADHGDKDAVYTRNLKARGQFVRTLAGVGMLWGTAYLQDLMAIEEEIRAKHESNRESLENLLTLRQSSDR